MKQALLPLMAIAALGCGDNAGTNPLTYNDISGTYVGALAGTSQGILLQATFTLAITQSGGGLGGSYSLTGTLSDGASSIGLAGGGSITGSIAAGNNPSVGITAVSGICPNVTTAFSGAYDSSNHLVTLRGSIPVFDANCQVVLTYPNSVLILSR
jgi:hypothetical protein